MLSALAALSVKRLLPMVLSPPVRIQVSLSPSGKKGIFNTGSVSTALDGVVVPHLIPLD